MRTCFSNRNGLTFSVAIGPDAFGIGFVMQVQAKTAINTAQPQKIVQPARNIVPDFSGQTKRLVRNVRLRPRRSCFPARSAQLNSFAVTSCEAATQLDTCAHARVPSPIWGNFRAESALYWPLLIYQLL